METDEKRIEELGFKAEQKGVFPDWQALTTKLKKEKGITLKEAAEIVYRNLV